MIWIVSLIIIVLLLAWYLTTPRTPTNLVTTPTLTPVEDKITYSEYYRIECCPECKRIIKDGKQARYYDRCCTKCGYSNGILFDTQNVTVRDVYKNGKYLETVIISEDDDDG
jgi:hypothetical protein